MRARAKYLVYAIAFLSLSAAASADVFIATDGDDTSGNGTLAQPYATLQKGIAALKSQGPGNTLYLRGGVYRTLPLGAFMRDGSYQGRGVPFWTLNNASSWDKAYTIRSYPGEWAVIDAAAYAGEQVVFPLYGGSANGAVGYVEISYLEIRNVSATVYGAGICTRGGPYKFHHLNIHDCNTLTSSNNPGGLLLENGTGDTTIEYCHFKSNAHLGGTANSAQIVIMSDYKQTAPPTTLHSATTGFSTSRHNNQIRYNFFDGGDGALKTPSAIHFKAVQYLASNTKSGQPVDTSGWSDQGDDVHHNIIINHSRSGVGQMSTDFGQVHHNVIVMPSGVTEAGIEIGEPFVGASGLRGPWRAVVYNNTVIGGGPGIYFEDKSNQDTVCHAQWWAYNNILDAPTDSDGRQDLSFNRDYSVLGATWDINTLLRVHGNYFYRPANASLSRIRLTDYTLAQINAAAWGGRDFSNAYDARDLLYAGTSGTDQYKARGGHVLSGSTTIANGGIGGPHPYLPGVTIPSYVGATDPSDSAWLDTVVSLPTSLPTMGRSIPAPAAPTGVRIK
ncbi:MAG TPA: hypothetical protein VGK32_10365 [Vicinamibacterales bacterium]|jgi:hypothetical protein